MRILYAAIILGLCAIISFWIAGSAFKYKSKAVETIVVTGLAEKDFASDLIVWNGIYSRKSMDLKSAYAMLKADERSIKQYLSAKGIQDNEIVFSAISINKEFNYFNDANGRQMGQEFTGYNLSQTVTVESNNIGKVDKVSRESTELIQSGIELTSLAPQFYNTKLSQIKMDLLAKASADARTRAEIIAKNAGSDLGELKKANMGVFQITGKNSNEDYSYGGAFNTSSNQKTGSITIRMEFAAE
ncbi:MAG: hypothetical protein K0S09_355 [Sphingobacteriaceae bacterium]|jgi:hypothetical protein|nr:hypothetical protein [Sphingobacteriaceae bacterium]